MIRGRGVHSPPADRPGSTGVKDTQDSEKAMNGSHSPPTRPSPGGGSEGVPETPAPIAEQLWGSRNNVSEVGPIFFIGPLDSDPLSPLYNLGCRVGGRKEISLP